MQNVLNLIIVLLYLVAVWDDFCLNISVNPLFCLAYPTKYKHVWIHETPNYKAGKIKAVSETEFIHSMNKYCKWTAMMFGWLKNSELKLEKILFPSFYANLSED